MSARTPRAGLRRVRVVLALSLAAVAAGGCSAAGGAAGGSGVTATGRTLDIYLSAPAGAADPRGQQDLLDAEQLAWTQGPQSAGGFRFALVKVTHPKLSDNARQAIEDGSAIAYLGEFAPGASGGTLGITNALDLLQLSPTDTASELTRAEAAVAGSPGVYYERLSTYGRTFARVVATTTQEAAGLVGSIAARRVHTLYVASDDTPYARVLAAAVQRSAAGRFAVKTGALSAAAAGASGADGVLVAASSPARAQVVIRQIAAALPAAQLFAPSALYSPELAAALGAAVRRLYVSVPGFLPRGLSAQGHAFVARFRATYGHAPDPRAIFGYEAMSALLATLARAGASANHRGVVVHDFLAIRNRSSALGTYSMNGSGDTNLTAFILTQLRAGRFVPVATLGG